MEVYHAELNRDKPAKRTYLFCILLLPGADAETWLNLITALPFHAQPALLFFTLLRSALFYELDHYTAWLAQEKRPYDNYRDVPGGFYTLGQRGTYSSPY